MEVVTYWNIIAQNGATTFHFDYVPPALVEWKYYFANCVFSPRLCWDSRQAFQYSGSVAYLFPLTVRPCSKTVRCTFSNRSILLTSNLTVRARIKLFVLTSVFIATVPLGKGVFPQSLFICCSGIVVIRHMKGRL